MMGPTRESVKRSITNVRPSDGGIGNIEGYRTKGYDLIDYIFDNIPEGRERSLALTHLEEMIMWGVKAICLGDPDAREIPIGEK
jgi:hypothetical protein